MRLSSLLLYILLSISTVAQAQAHDYKTAHIWRIEGNGKWDYLTLDDPTGRLFISHGNVVQVMDVTSGQVIATIPDTKGVHGITLAHDLGKGYISCGKANTVQVFDLHTLTVLKTIPVTGSNPDGILYDPFSHKVFAFNGKTANATVIDALTDSIIATIALSGKPEFPATDQRGHIYVNIEDKDMLTVINATTDRVVTSWPVAPGTEPGGQAIDTAHHRLYSACANQKVVAIDYHSGKVVDEAIIGDDCDGLVYDNALQRIYTANGDGTMTVIDASKNSLKILANVPTLKGARTIAISQASHHLYLPTADLGPAPPATKENPEPRPAVKDDTFRILDIAPDSK